MTETPEAELFDATGMYDDDYLHFFAAPPGAAAGPSHGPGTPTAGTATDPTGTVADLVWRLLDLRPEHAVLDLACGHGPLANPLAARGCRVTGLDSSAVFLDRARTDAAAAGVDVDYVLGDMRRLEWTARFDRVVNWSTAFGYFDDDTDRAVLAGIARALRPGGRLAIDLDNLTAYLASYTPSRVVAARDDDLMVDRYRLDPVTGRLEAERTVVRDGRARRLTFVKRLFGFPELRDWLRDAGFADVRAYGEDGRALAADHRRMIVVAGLPAA